MKTIDKRELLGVIPDCSKAWGKKKKKEKFNLNQKGGNLLSLSLVQRIKRAGQWQQLEGVKE